MKIVKVEIKRIRRFGLFVMGGSVEIEIEEKFPALSDPFKVHIQVVAFVPATGTDSFSSIEGKILKKAVELMGRSALEIDDEAKR